MLGKQVWMWLSNISLLSLFVVILLWNTWIGDDELQHVPRSIELLIFLFPLAWLTRGMFNGRVTTHVYATFVMVFYLPLGVWFSLTPGEEWYGYIMTAASGMIFIGSFMYIRSNKTVTA